jgi:hypothetical protein
LGKGRFFLPNKTAELLKESYGHLMDDLNCSFSIFPETPAEPQSKVYYLFHLSSRGLGEYTRKNLKMEG